MNLHKLFDARQTNANRDAEYLKASGEYPDNFYLKLAAKAVKMQSTANSKKDMRVETNVLGNDVVVSNHNGVFSIGINGKLAFRQNGTYNLVENMVLSILDKEYAGELQIKRPDGRTIDSERKEWSKMEKDGYSLPFDKLLASKAKDVGGQTKGTNYKMSHWLSERVYNEAVKRDPSLADVFNKIQGYKFYLRNDKKLYSLKDQQVLMPDGKTYDLDKSTFERILNSNQIDEILARNKNLRDVLLQDDEKFIAISDKDVYRIFLGKDDTWIFKDLKLI